MVGGVWWIFQLGLPSSPLQRESTQAGPGLLARHHAWVRMGTFVCSTPSSMGGKSVRPSGANHLLNVSHVRFVMPGICVAIKGLYGDSARSRASSRAIRLVPTPEAFNVAIKVSAETLSDLTSSCVQHCTQCAFHTLSAMSNAIASQHCCPIELPSGVS